MQALRFWLITIIIIGGSIAWFRPGLFMALTPSRNEYKLVKSAWENKQSNLVVEIKGKVIIEYPDIQDGTTYQQFKVELENRHHVLISHDIGVAKPVSVAVGSEVHIKGEYDWTPEGGVIHWTHSDPSGVREGGWIELDDVRYD